MPALVLWKRLSETDFNAMNADASPYGRGGGARHIALGVNSDDFMVDGFLNAPLEGDVTIAAESENLGTADLQFSSNPGRRGGEWTIRDQYTHRHPAWTTAAGFPSTYDTSDPPYILVLAVGRRFHARTLRQSNLIAARAALPPNFLEDARGISRADDRLLKLLSVQANDILEAYEDQAAAEPSTPFNPADVADGRRQIFAAIIRRQGQPAFRRKLVKAYRGRCAITRTAVPWVLEAAHITPYKGTETNLVQNGLLLRADIHTLFDLGLIAIVPASLRVAVSSLLKESAYYRIDGKSLLVPKNVASRPSPLALEEHYGTFRK